MQAVSYIVKLSGLPEKSIEHTLNLLNEGATVPFISRYRKEATGNLDEVAIEAIKKANDSFIALQKRKEAILKALTEQGVLTDKLSNSIASAETLTAVEDLYLPYKKKRQTKAEVARKAGLEPLAKILSLIHI